MGTRAARLVALDDDDDGTVTCLELGEGDQWRVAGRCGHAGSRALAAALVQQDSVLAVVWASAGRRWLELCAWPGRTAAEPSPQVVVDLPVEDDAQAAQLALVHVVAAAAQLLVVLLGRALYVVTVPSVPGAPPHMATVRLPRGALPHSLVATATPTSDEAADESVRHDHHGGGPAVLVAAADQLFVWCVHTCGGAPSVAMGLTCDRGGEQVRGRCGRVGPDWHVADGRVCALRPRAGVAAGGAAKCAPAR
jgi:hypothetical protein